jgi:dihydrodipicolinate synthase/N-acetylneuraminate lyase
MLRRHKEPAPPPAIGGVYVAAITPRREREVEVDLGAMLDLVDFLSGQHVQGITLFGTTGEFLHFTTEERSRYVALLTKRSRVPVLANVSHSTLDGAILMAEEAAGAGIAAVLVMPPYYFRYSPEATETFLLQFAQHVAKWVPVFLYNIPAFTDPIPLTVIQRAMGTGMFAGIKDSSGDWEVMQQLIALRQEQPFTILVGDDSLFTRSRRFGVDGVVSGVACAVPELMTGIDRCIQSGRIQAADALDARLQEFIEHISDLPVPAGIKTAVGVRGIKAGPLAAPLGAAGTQRIEQFQQWFRDWLPQVQKECKDALG